MEVFGNMLDSQGKTPTTGSGMCTIEGWQPPQPSTPSMWCHAFAICEDPLSPKAGAQKERAKEQMVKVGVCSTAGNVSCMIQVACNVRGLHV